MIIKSAGKSDIGLVRSANEDSIKLVPDRDLYIVCDGMGGHNAGEVASSLACEMISALYSFHFERLLNDERLKLPRMFPPSSDVLAKTVRIANHWIHKQASSDQSLNGMGTTIVAAVIEQDILTVAHVGDSRAYRLYHKKLTPLTVDHSWAAELEQSERISAEEARLLVNRNVITRALGVKEAVDVDLSVRRVVEDDIYIFCSDGLCGFVDDPDIEEVAAACHEDIDKIVTDLVALANQRGGSDNVSVVALKVTGKVTPAELPELERVTIDGEPAEYFEPEEEWARAIVEKPVVEDASGETGSGGFVRLFGAAVIVVVIAAIIYLMFKE